MYIYGLCDPRTSELRYVGAAINPVERLRLHIAKKERTHKSTWIQSLQKLGLLPEMFIIEEVSNEIWKREERFWIAYFRFIGADLTNATNGGDGVLGLKHSPQSKEKMGKWQCGKKTSEATRRRLSEALRGERHWNFGKHPSEETRLKLIRSHLGKHLSEETKRKLSEINSHPSAETRAKIGAKSKGNKHRLGTHQSEQAKKKIGAASIGNTHNCGRHRSPEYCQKMSESIRAWWASRRKKSVHQLPLL